jgi:Tfp pilus assembly protein PilO
MAKFNDNQRLLMIGGAGLGLALLACGGVYWVYGQIDEVQQQITAKRQQIAGAEAKIKNIPGLEKDVIILRENVGEYTKILPEERELTDFLRTVTLFKQQSGVRIEEVKDEKDKSDAKFNLFTYKIRFTGTIWQFMKFLNCFESDERFLRVSEFNVSTGAGRRGATGGIEGDVVHKGEMKVETYVYTGAKSGNKAGAVNIVAYETKRDKLSEEIWQNRQLIRLEKYEFRDARGRRDILVDPRQGPGRSADTVPIETQQKTVESFAERVSQLVQVFERSRSDSLTFLERYKIEKKLRDELATLQAQIEEVRIKDMITWQPLRQRWNIEVEQPFESVYASVFGASDDPNGGAALAIEEMESLLAQMRKDFRNDELVQLRDRFESVQSKLDVAAQDPRFDLALEIGALYKKAGIALEFGQITLDITGVVVNGAGRSGLLINGDVYEEGDYLTDSLLLQRVGREEAEFVFKGFTVIKGY